MERDGRPPRSRARRLVVVAPFILAAGLALLYDVMRDIPAGYGCGGEPPGQDAAVAAYRSGAVPLHLLAIAWALGAVVLLSVAGKRAIGKPTAAALGLVVIVVSVALLGNDVASGLVLVPLLLVVIGFTALAGPLGAAATGAVAAVLLLGAGVGSARAVDAARTVAPRAALWALALLAGAHLLLVEHQGSGAFVC